MSDDEEPSGREEIPPAPPGSKAEDADQAPANPAPEGGAPAGGAAEASSPKPPRPKPTEEEIAEALNLMAMHLDLEDLTCREIDERLGSHPGFTSKVLRGELPCSKTRGLQMRAAMGIDEDEFQAMMAEVLARRELEPASLVRSPHKPRARNPRSARTTGRRKAEPDDDPSPLQTAAVVRAIKQLKAELEDELIRQGKLKKRPRRPRKKKSPPQKPASQEGGS